MQQVGTYESRMSFTQKERKIEKGNGGHDMTWSNDDESSSEDEAQPKEIANLCLMDHENEDEVTNSNSSQITFNELQDTFDELMSEFKKVGIKNSLLKKRFGSLSKENEDL